jgi:hypothetical protein
MSCILFHYTRMDRRHNFSVSRHGAALAWIGVKKTARNGSGKSDTTDCHTRLPCPSRLIPGYIADVTPEFMVYTFDDDNSTVCIHQNKPIVSQYCTITQPHYILISQMARTELAPNVGRLSRSEVFAKRGNYKG